MNAASILNGEEISLLIKSQGLVSGFIDLGKQLTPNGIDITAAEIQAFAGPGAVDFDNSQRVLPEFQSPCAGREGLPEGWWHLSKGAYRVRSNETVSLPLDMIAFAFPRSTLMRCGAFTQTGVWDAGFKGKSEFILVVENPFGIRIKRNSRLIQLVFSRMSPAAEGYKGIYQQK